jgi:hypothetical protein
MKTKILGALCVLCVSCLSLRAADDFLWRDAFQMGAGNGNKNCVFRATDNGNGTWTPVVKLEGGIPAGTAVIGHVVVDNFPGTVNIGNVVVIKPTGAANPPAAAQVTTSTTSSQLIAARSTRRSVAIKNTDAAITIYYGTGTVTSANGFPLKPGESQVVDSTAAINVVAASGTPIVATVETYD